MWILGRRKEIIVTGTPEQRMAAIARRQRGRVARGQLVAAGFSDGAIQRRLANGALIPEHPAVYRVDAASVLPLGPQTSVLLSLWPQAALSHQSAAALWKIGPADRPIHVLTGAAWAGRRRGVRIHRSTSFDACDVRFHEDLPVTSPARTLIDCAATTSAYRLERMFTEVVTLELTTPKEIRATMERVGPRAGVPRLRALLEAEIEVSGPTQSESERRLVRLVARAGLPSPITGHKLFGFDADLYWPQHNLVVEVDSYGFHNSRWAYERDRRKDATFRSHNLTTMRFSRRQIRDEPLLVVAQIAAGIAAAAAPPPSRPSRDGREAAAR